MKIKSSILVVLALGIFLLNSCKSSETETEQDEVTTGWDEVMAVHDEIMPLTMKLPPLWEQLDSLKDNVDNTEVEIIKQQITDLQDAHKAMYSWMDDANSIQKALKSKETAAALQQLVDEKARINQVKTDTDTAFENATALIKKLTAK